MCFWNRYNFAWPCRPEPSHGRTVLTTADEVLGSAGIRLSDLLDTFRASRGAHIEIY
jgi:hypothetical protein